MYDFSKSYSMKHVILILLMSLCVLVSGTALAEKKAPGREMAIQATKDKKLWITADHSKFDVLKKTFQSGPEVTKACLSCHTEAAKQFQQTIHWTWLDPTTEKTAMLGKGGLSVNNF